MKIMLVVVGFVFLVAGVRDWSMAADWWWIDEPRTFRLLLINVAVWCAYEFGRRDK